MIRPHESSLHTEKNTSGFGGKDRVSCLVHGDGNLPQRKLFPCSVSCLEDMDSMDMMGQQQGMMLDSRNRARVWSQTGVCVCVCLSRQSPGVWKMARLLIPVFRWIESKKRHLLCESMSSILSQAPQETCRRAVARESTWEAPLPKLDRIDMDREW